MKTRNSKFKAPRFTIQDLRSVFHVSRFTFHDQRAYTLIELLVAMSVFVIITSIAIGGYVRGIKTSRQSAALASANSNVASVLEQMMRELRVGFGIQDCLNGCVSFKNSASKEIVYKYNDGEKRIERGEGGATPITITDANVEIEYLNFIFYTGLPTEYPNRVTIQVGIKTDEPGVDGGVINLQTTVSARN